MRLIKSGAALVLAMGVSLAGHAAGLGKLTVNSALGQILNAEIDLVALQPGEADTLNARIAPPEAFSDAHVEYTPALRLLRFSVEKHSNGQPYLKLTSIAPINEPFLDALVEVSWPAGRLQREYPILLDPPGYAERKVNAPAVAAAPAPSPAAAEPPKTAAAEPTATQPETPPAATTPAAPPSAATEATGTPSAQAEMSAAGAGTATPASDTYGPVEKGDTLNKIAEQVKPAEVSLEQMLVALYRQNESAFSGKNMNRLKTGQILKIPTADEVGQIKPVEARREIHAQVQEWNNYREQLAGGVGSMPAAGAAPNISSGRIASAAVTPPPAPAAAPTDTLRISKSNASGKGGAGKGADRVAAMQEELTAKDQALKESQSRVADLEKQIKDMQRLLDLRGGAGGKGEAPKVAAVASPPPTTPAKAPEPVAAKPEPAKPAPEPAKPAEPPKAAETPPTNVASATPNGEAPKPAPPKTAAAPKKPPPKKVAAPPPKGIMDVLMDNPAYLAAGAGVIALLGIGGFMVTRRRRGSSMDGPSSQMTSAFPSDLKPGAATSKPAAGLVDTGNSSFLTDFDKTGPGTIDTDEVDPVAEAEVYIAYGRDAQAEEILKEAMARDRNRHEIALKLLEIYHARKSATAYETVAKELRAAVGEGSPLWMKAAAMGAQIDPTNPLYGSAAGATATFSAMAPSAPAAAPPKPDLDFDLAGSSGGVPAGGASSAPPSFDLDLDSRRSEAGPDLATDSSHGLDFDLAPSSASAPAAPAHVDVPAEAPKEDKHSFDFDLSGLDISPKSSAPAPASSGSGLDLADLSLDTPGAADSAGGAEAVGTKLELAKAYLEIGDKDGAREILQEVAKEGSSAQKEEAKKLIASL